MSWNSLLRLAIPLFLTAAVLVAYPLPLNSKVYIDINAPGGRRFPIAIPHFSFEAGPPEDAPLARSVAETVGVDLSSTRVFEVIDRRSYLVNPLKVGPGGAGIDFHDWTTIGAEALVSGTLRINGDQARLTGKVYDTINGSLILGREYTGSKADLEKALLNGNPGGAVGRRGPAPGSPQPFRRLGFLPSRSASESKSNSHQNDCDPLLENSHHPSPTAC